MTSQPKFADRCIQTAPVTVEVSSLQFHLTPSLRPRLLRQDLQAHCERHLPEGPRLRRRHRAFWPNGMNAVRQAGLVHHDGEKGEKDLIGDDGESKDEEFAIVFAAMGVNMETAHFFKQARAPY